MRAILLSLLLLASGQLSLAAPAPTDKPDTWEYAELVAGPRRLMAPPDGGGPVVVAPPNIRWTTGKQEITTAGWSEMSTKLKAPAIDKNDSLSLQKIKFLNYLGSERWELVSHHSGNSSPNAGRGARPGGEVESWLFKRRAR